MFERITKRVTQVGGPRLSDGNDCLVYLVDLGDLVLIDNGAGPSWPKIRDNIREAGFDPRSIHTLILTHCHIDHIGATSDVIRETGCAVLAHELDTAAIESGDPRRTAASWYGLDLPPIEVSRQVSEPDVRLTFREGELRLVHTPGHTPGSMVVVLDEVVEDAQDARTTQVRVLFGQDIHGPFVDDFGSDLDQWRGSMEKLLTLEADILCEGHYGVYKPESAVREFIESQLAAH